MKYREQSTESKVQRTKNREQRTKNIQTKNREAQLLAPPEIVWEYPVLPFRG